MKYLEVNNDNLNYGHWQQVIMHNLIDDMLVKAVY